MLFRRGQRSGGQPNNARLRYWVTCAARQFTRQGRRCPACGFARSEPVARKYVVTELRRCRQCELLFRVPTTPEVRSDEFYQDEYTDGVTTETPTDAELSRMLASGFKGSEKDYARYIAVLDALGVPAGANVFEFGCSWGYGAWQLRAHGFDVEAFEVSRGRAEYARRKLDLGVVNAVPIGSHRFDVFLSVHVLEHVPGVTAAIQQGMSVLKPGGLFIAFTPNGSAAFRQVEAELWMRAWGLVHPNFMDDRYYLKGRGGQPFVLMTDPYKPETLSAWSRDRRQLTADLSGPELLFVAVAP